MPISQEQIDRFMERATDLMRQRFFQRREILMTRAEAIDRIVGAWTQVEQEFCCSGKEVDESREQLKEVLLAVGIEPHEWQQSAEVKSKPLPLLDSLCEEKLDLLRSLALNGHSDMYVFKTTIQHVSQALGGLRVSDGCRERMREALLFAEPIYRARMEANKR